VRLCVTDNLFRDIFGLDASDKEEVCQRNVESVGLDCDGRHFWKRSGDFIKSNIEARLHKKTQPKEASYDMASKEG